jgi:hypothetical protein
MKLFGMLFAINILAALVAFGFFIIGLADGSVTTFNILIWGAMLGTLFSLPFLAWLMRLRGHGRVGMVLMLPVAGVAVVAALAMLIMVVSPPSWR